MRPIKRILSHLFFLVAPKIRWPFPSGRVLILRLDEIGDYILFRNFIQALAEDDRWKRYRITLLGNVVFRDIAETFDRQYVSEFIWIDPRSLNKPRYLLWLIVKLKVRGFDVAINPIYTKGAIHDNLLLFSGSKKIIETGPNPSQFEYYNNRAFITKLTGKPDHTKYSLPFKKSHHIDPSQPNVVVFPGAGDAFRQWQASSFASLISAMPGCRFIVAGSSNDTPLAKSIAASVSFPVVNLTGKTSLVELIDLIGSCQLLISNETSAVHIAAATGTAAICISNGNHFGRFNPYPVGLSDKIITVYPTDDFYSSDERVINDLRERYKVRSDIDINLITVERVKARVSETSLISFLTGL